MKTKFSDCVITHDKEKFIHKILWYNVGIDNIVWDQVKVEMITPVPLVWGKDGITYDEKLIYAGEEIGIIRGHCFLSWDSSLKDLEPTHLLIVDWSFKKFHVEQ
jgi:hypothetical protein